MLFTNHFPDDVVVFQYGQGDKIWPLIVAAPINSLFTAWPSNETIIKPGQTLPLPPPPGGVCYIGVKRASWLGRLQSYIAAPTLDIYDATANFELNFACQLTWLNPPVASDPNEQLPVKELMKQLPAAPGYLVGVGKAEVTDPAAQDSSSELPLQGWANPSQVSSGIESKLYARAFIVGDPSAQQRVVIVIVDIWSCTIALKQAVIERLQRGNSEMPYRTDNIHIAGTHTHSAPAGFSHHFLYNAMAFGFDPHVFECYVRGIVRAIERAHQDLKPGAVYLDEADLSGITRNRSMPAFVLNTAADTAPFPHAVDERMTMLKFTHSGTSRRDPDMGIGALTWFAIHPTNRGKSNSLVNGDNKGCAAEWMEMGMLSQSTARKGFVAAFANSSCGDASGNFLQNSPPDTFDPPFDDDPLRLISDGHRMRFAAQRQVDVATHLYHTAKLKLSRPLGIRHQILNMAKRTGTPGALGLSMGAGSTEDGGPMTVPPIPAPLVEGMRLVDPTNPTLTSAGFMTTFLLPITAVMNAVVSSISALVHPTSALAAIQAIKDSTAPDYATIVAQYPKPILFLPGAVVPTPLTPNVLPIQLLSIGEFLIIGMPAEVTTVAGLQLRRAVARGLGRAEETRAVVGTYANGYAGYVTTAAEYNAQQYEGASTLFGPSTCDVFANAFQKMATALIAKKAVVDDMPLPDLRQDVLTKRRVTFRNLSNTTQQFRIYLVGDENYFAFAWPGWNFSLPPGAERAVIYPFPYSTFLQNLQVVVGSAAPRSKNWLSLRVFPRTSDLVLIDLNGTPIATPYFPAMR